MTLKGMVKCTRNMLGRYVDKWFYEKEIPFDAANSPYFPLMVNAIQRAGPEVKPRLHMNSVGQYWMKRWRKLESGLKNINRVGTFMTDGWLNKIVKEVGDKHVIQFIKDNTCACVSTGSKLMDKRKHLVWTPCAAHNIDM
ncbi:hypothetical protein AMTR_s00156p00047380 [Amborella trichopoda]|uniref:DUF659 domain-containing protein n=1 Tax=Amborella trichopoda TaxID=13333 RepID=W1PKW0_AMBTC|nr:hypothetical protein AMTR_s00156p00047380 [Amborella trichopoda]